MKYVIFKRQIDIMVTYHPVFIAEHTTHSQVKYDEPNVEVYSAGFFTIKDGFVNVDPNKKSESLGIGPQPKDSILLSSVLLNAGSYAFTEYIQ